MINKDSIYAQAGERGAVKTDTQFREGAGIQSGHVALATDVNQYHNMTDAELYVVCQEIINLLGLFGVQPDDTRPAQAGAGTQYAQLADMFNTKLAAPAFLTGILAPATDAATMTGSATTITFPEMTIGFNLDVYYGSTKSRYKTAILPAQTLSATTAWDDGVHFIYAQLAGDSVTLQHDTSPIDARDGASKCFLGSVFVIDGHFQVGSWKFQPWLQVTSIDHREAPTAYTKGGFISSAGTQNTSFQMGALQILDEGINYVDDKTAPSIVDIEAKNPFRFKYLYPDYDPSSSELSAIPDTNKIYNAETGAMEDIPSQPYDQYVVYVPCIVPTGQTLLIPPMKTASSNPVFKTQQEARDAIFGLQYDLINENGHSVAARAIYLGQSIVVKVGSTDFSDPDNFMAVGTLPQALAGFTSAAGQSGGGSGAYIPMRQVTFGADYTASSQVTCVNNAANVIVGNKTVVATVKMPQAPVNGIINQFEIHYTHTATSKGIQWPSNLYWWGSAPSFVAGTTYNIIVEYLGGKWRAGYLSMDN